MVLKTFKETTKIKDKNKGHTREFKSDDPTTYLTNVEQQKNMLLDTIDDAKAKKIKKINKWVEPELNKDISKIKDKISREVNFIIAKKVPRDGIVLYRKEK